MKYDNKVYINRLFALRAGKKHNLKVKREYTLKQNNLKEKYYISKGKIVKIYVYGSIKSKCLNSTKSI
jgi:hypothetical protein